MPGIARLGDTSSHGGTIVSAASYEYVNGRLVARVGDLHSCPIRGHGVTKIINGSGNFKCEEAIVAVIGSKAGCGATITSGSGNSFAPLESPSNSIKLGSGRIGGILG